MPAFLITLLTAILKPVVEQILMQLGYAIDMKTIQAQMDRTNAALKKVAEANTEDERKQAIKDLAASVNN